LVSQKKTAEGNVRGGTN